MRWSKRPTWAWCATSITGFAVGPKWSVVAEALPQTRRDVPEMALDVVAENNDGERHTIYIFPNAWGYSCSPACRKENAFIMVPQDKKPPQW